MSDQLKRLRQKAKKLRLSGDLLNAKIAYLNVLKILPDDVDALLDLGDIHMQLEDFTAASRVYARIIERHPKNPLVQANLGGALLRLGKVAEARTVLQYALELEPKNIYARINLGGVLQSQGELRLALENALEAVSIDPTHPLAFNNLGSAFSDLAMFKEAKHAFETATMLDPTSIDALINLAASESKLGNRQAAIDRYEQVLSMLPPAASQRAEAVRFFASFEYLGLGELEKGWDYYEGGFSPMVPLTGARSPKRKFDAPRWTGELLSQKRLLVWAEQGLGDELNFGTCLPELLDLDGTVILEVDPRLVSIFQRSFPSFLVRPTSYDKDSMLSLHNDFDCHIPLASLHRIYRRTLESFSSNEPFLKVDPAWEEEFAKRIKRADNEIIIGLCWRSGKLNPTRNLGYTTALDLEPVLKMKNCRYVNVQYGNPEQEILSVERELGVKIEYWDDVDYKNDLEKVFGILRNVDILVSVGSAPYAMAGSIGKLALVLAGAGWPCFGQKDLKKNRPWYKTVYSEPRARTSEGLSPYQNFPQRITELLAEN
jgi:tetratricopeptide (TPR) repeat protein